MKIWLRTAVFVAAFAALGLGTTATVVAEPNDYCYGYQGVQDAWLEPDTHLRGAATGATGMANLCGTEEGPPGTTRRYYKDALLILPEGAKLRCNNPNFKDNATGCPRDEHLEAGSFAGYAPGGLVGERGVDYGFVRSLTYVGNAPDHGTRPGLCSQEGVKACYQAVDAAEEFGTSTITVKKCTDEPACAALGLPAARDREVIHAYEPDPLGPVQTYAYALGTKTEPYKFCRYAGAQYGDSCGTDGRRWIGKNPPVARTYGCGASLAKAEGYVIYTFGTEVGPFGVHKPWDPPDPRWVCIPVEITGHMPGFAEAKLD